ncbi:hypothetical protein JHK87_010208 [Glycine soja]|nr:hypothetical protein JHK87_010208 [Glycine soja]
MEVALVNSLSIEDEAEFSLFPVNEIVHSFSPILGLALVSLVLMHLGMVDEMIDSLCKSWFDNFCSFWGNSSLGHNLFLLKSSLHKSFIIVIIFTNTLVVLFYCNLHSHQASFAEFMSFSNNRSFGYDGSPCHMGVIVLFPSFLISVSLMKAPSGLANRFIGKHHLEVSCSTEEKSLIEFGTNLLKFLDIEEVFNVYRRLILNLDKSAYKKRYFKPKDKNALMSTREELDNISSGEEIEEEEEANLCLMTNTTSEGSDFESDEEVNIKNLETL